MNDSNNIFNSENNMLNTNKINENIAGESMMDFETIKYIDLNRNVCHEFITDFMNVEKCTHQMIILRIELKKL